MGAGDICCQHEHHCLCVVVHCGEFLAGEPKSCDVHINRLCVCVWGGGGGLREGRARKGKGREGFREWRVRERTERRKGEGKRRETIQRGKQGRIHRGLAWALKSPPFLMIQILELPFRRGCIHNDS